MSKPTNKISPNCRIEFIQMAEQNSSKSSIGDMMKNYKPRIADRIATKKLKGKGALLIEGPKWCGKTTTAEQLAGSVLYMSDPAAEKQNLEMMELNPRLLLEGAVPRLIDEWQIAPKLWDAVRFEVDHREEDGQFILTGSAVPADTSKIFHTGTGRFAWLRMRTMSLYESGESDGTISLKNLFEEPIHPASVKNLSLEELAFLVCRGGWPRATYYDDETALEQAFDYYDAIVNTDISRADGVKRTSVRVRALMRSYARNQGSQIRNQTLRNDIAANDSDSLDTDTVVSYINALKKIFVIEETEAWNPNLRSKTAIRSSNTRYFTDPSIGTAALGLGPKDLLNDLETFGLFFETLCVRDLRVYADVLNGQIYHYRDKTGLECDAVIHLRSGSYGLIEIKLGGETAIEHGANTLKTLRNKIDTQKMKEPSFLMVLTGVGNYAYQRADGVYVIPIGCLRD